MLEIGTGSGYLTALLALMADRVYSVERLRELSQRARRTLDSLGVNNVALLVGDGTIGWRKYAPFDVIASAFTVVAAGTRSSTLVLVAVSWTMGATRISAAAMVVP